MSDQPDQPAAAAKTMDINQIMSLLPHRYPFLLIDRLIEIEPRKRVVALKNVTINEPHFAGHFPNFPIMPGVLIIEAIAQAGAALLLTEYSAADRANKLMLFTSIDKTRIRRQVVPGDQLRIEVTVLNWRSNAVKMHGTASVDGKLVCEGTVMCAMTNRKSAEPAAAPAGASAE
jgi:3-hydroxyacyl-[acyl-carrier-protein] dehydratase